MGIDRFKHFIADGKFLLISAAIVLAASSLITFEFFNESKALYRVVKYSGIGILSFFIAVRYLVFRYRTKPYELFFFGYFFFSFLSALVNSESVSQMFLYLDIPLVVIIVFFGFSSLLLVSGNIPGLVFRILVLVGVSSGINILHNLARFLYLVIVFKDKTEKLTYLHLPYNWKGLVSNPNYNAYLMLSGLVALTLIFWFMIRDRRQRINVISSSYAVLFFVIIGMIGLTQCRAVVLSIIVGIICVIAMNLTTRPVLKLRNKFMIVTIAAVTASVLVFYKSLFAVLLYKTFASGSSARIEMWQTFFGRLVSDLSPFHFLLGYGGSVTYHPYNLVSSSLGLANFVFDTLARSGFLALVMLIVFTSIVFLTNIHRRNHMLNIALTVLLIPNLFEDFLVYLGFNIESILFFVIVVYAMEILPLSRSREKVA
jgi:hypothetical protein